MLAVVLVSDFLLLQLQQSLEEGCWKARHGTWGWSCKTVCLVVKHPAMAPLSSDHARHFSHWCNVYMMAKVVHGNRQTITVTGQIRGCL